MRDLFLGVPSKDIDYTVEASSFEAMREMIVARGGKILWLHRGAHPGDLPSADELVDRVRRNL